VKFSALRKYLIVLLCTGFSGLCWADSISDLESKVLGDAKDDPVSEDLSAKDDDSSSTPEKEEVETPKNSARSLEEVEKLIWGPKEIPNEHILVVQKRFIKKAGSFELVPIQVGIQPANSFTRQVQWGASFGYHLTESFGLEILHLSFASNDFTTLETSINNATGLKIRHNDNSVLVAGSGLIWTPFKSKAATLKNAYHFEGYFVAGGGTIKAETSQDPMAMGAFGFRSYLNQDAIFKIELRDYMQFGGSTVHRLSLLFGAGLLL
jgi:outer membrane beta-barrel protein